MLSPEEQQLKICLLKSNLEEINNILVVQRSASMPELDAQSEQQYRETMTALRVFRAQNAETERLKQENTRLAAKRTQLKRQCEAAAAALQAARLKRNQIADLIKDEEQNDEQNIRSYEDFLQKKAERFRMTRRFYNQEEMARALEEVSEMNSKLEGDVARRRNVVSDLKLRLEVLEPHVPDNLPALMGKMELDERLKITSENCEELRAKMNELSRKESSLSK